jgi:inner membrane protein
LDSLTHIVLGATLGEALAGKSLGKRAMVLGALAQSLPDIDFVAAFWLPTANNLLAHRGFTHSILCTVLTAILLGFASKRWYPSAYMSSGKWIAFFGIQITGHIFLDAFNSYGVGWFEPFSHTRISFNTLFVADPFYSTWLAMACAALLILKNESPSRRRWVQVGLGLSTLYLIYAVSNKLMIDGQVRKILKEQSIPDTHYFTTPTPFNSWLWFIVAEDKAGFQVGHRSVFDKFPTEFRHFNQNDSLLGAFGSREDICLLKKFSEGYYTVDRKKDTLVFNDLRFGQITGWTDPDAPFVFHYYVEYPDDNLMVIQRGRLTGWNRSTPSQVLKRIKGI